MLLLQRALGCSPQAALKPTLVPSPSSAVCLQRRVQLMKRTRESDAEGVDGKRGPAAPASAAVPEAATTAGTSAHTSFTAPSAALTIDTAAYDSQLETKLAKLKALFADMSMPEVEIRTSEPQHYRMRAEFNVRGTRREDVKPHYIMFATGDKAAEGPAAAEGEAAQPEGQADADQAAGEGASTSEPAAAAAAEGAAQQKGGQGGRGKGRGKRSQARKPQPQRVEIQSFPVGSRLINELMPLVLDECAKNPILKESLFQVRLTHAGQGCTQASHGGCSLSVSQSAGAES